jgi:hypothetical protein
MRAITFAALSFVLEYIVVNKPYLDAVDRRRIGQTSAALFIAALVCAIMGI